MFCTHDVSKNYGRYKDGNKFCYKCCGILDLHNMRISGKAILYFDYKRDYNYGTVRNWPGSLDFNTGLVRKSRHNWGLTRYDYWFILDGYFWHGYTIGNGTQIAHCKRTKTIFTPAKSCPINPTCLKG